MDNLTSLILFVYYIILLQFIYFLLPQIRRNLKETVFFEKHLHYFVIIRQALLFFAPLAISVSIMGLTFTSQQLTSLFVLGLSINVFWVVQWPLLTKAHILVTFTSKTLSDAEADEGYDEKFSSKIIFEAEKITLVKAAIYNLGFSTYKNATVLIYFGKHFKIIPCDDEEFGPRLKKLDFSKCFSLQKRHGGIAFAPKENCISIPPQEVFLFPVYLHVPASVPKEERWITVQFYSENSWGMTEVKVPFEYRA